MSSAAPVLPSPSGASYTAFAGTRRIAAGQLPDVVRAVAASARERPDEPTPLVFDDGTGRTLELDLRGTPEDAVARALNEVAASTPAATSPEAGPDDAPPVPRGRGRPRLGVVAREITLLPRHWDWLARQPGGASVTLRKLVNEAQRQGTPRDQLRAAQERCYRFMGPVAGNLPGYEEALRALYARQADAFDALTASWPEDVRHYARQLAQGAFANDSS
ncbi:MAG: DUF2239 family protein [Ramlibacter sp.]|nr:DUF2239 family protein [Ramlibacter sp.]